MPIGPHIHDQSGHRYGKGDLPVAKLANATLKAFTSARDKRRGDLEKKRKQDEANRKKDESKKEQAPKDESERGGGGGGNKVQITVGDNIPVRPSGDRPSPVKRGESGKFEPNTDYGKSKQADTDFNAALREQLIIQNHSSAQFSEHMVHVPGKPMPATGYGPTNKKTGTTNKAQIGKIQETAQKIEAARQRNAAMRRPQPEAGGTTPPATGEAPKPPSAS